jgi:hypothetical protein
MRGILSAGNWKIWKTWFVRSSASAVTSESRKLAHINSKQAKRKADEFTPELPHFCATESILEFVCAKTACHFTNTGVFPDKLRPMNDDLK